MSGSSNMEMTTASGDTASGSIYLSKSTIKHSGVTTTGGTLNIYSGTYDVSGSTVAQHTISNLNMYGGTLDARNGLGSFDSSTITGTWNYYAGLIIMDPGTTLTI